MSSDIFYSNLSNLVTFYMGERPSADKFNAVNKYFSRGMIELASAIGDIHDKGWPYHTLSGVGKGIGAPWNLSGAGNKARDLDIVNLARLIGPASNLNARMFTNVDLDTKSIEEQVPVGVFEFETNYPMHGSPTITGLVAVATEFTDTNQFTISGNKKILFSSVTTENLIASYESRPSDYYGGADYQFAGFNVIPDPNQSAGLTITETGTAREYLITFPTIQAQQSSLIDLDDSTLGTAAEFNNAKQYQFPKWLNDIMVSAESKKIPHNYIYLKNRITREIFKDAEYTWESASSLLVSNVDICEENGAIPGNNYCIITIGANITNYIDDIRLKLFKHDHSGMFGEPLVSIKHLADKYEFEPPSGIYGPSGLSWNQLPMYLHRDGYVTDSNGNNGNNAMRGDLMMGLTSYNPITSKDIATTGAVTGATYKICFGNENVYLKHSGPYFLIYNAIDKIRIQSDYNDIELTTGNDLQLYAVNQILVNDSMKIKSGVADLTTDYATTTIDRSNHNIFEKNFVIEKKAISKNTNVASTTEKALIVNNGWWNNSSSNPYYGSFSMLNDSNVNFAKSITKNLIGITDFKTASIMSTVDVKSNFYIDYDFHHSDGSFDYSLVKTTAPIRITNESQSNPNTSATSKGDAALLDTYIVINRGVVFDTYVEESYLVKNSGYISSNYSIGAWLEYQGSVNIDFMYRRESDPTNSNGAETISLKRLDPTNVQSRSANVEWGTNGPNQYYPLTARDENRVWLSETNGNWVFEKYEDDLAEDFANNHIHWILDYRIKGNNIYKDPEDSNWSGSATPTVIRVNASLEYKNETYIGSYNSTSGSTSSYKNSISCSDPTETKTAEDFIKYVTTNNNINFKKPIQNGVVNLTAIFIDLILGDKSTFKLDSDGKLNQVPYNQVDTTLGGELFISRSFDFDISITEEKFSDILILTVKFVNVEKIADNLDDL